jgi:hypothetical protein
MTVESTSKIIRVRYDEVEPPTPEEIEAMLAIPDDAIDTSDIPECSGGERLIRDEHWKLVPQKSVLRDAIVAAMTEQGLTAYALWKLAKVHCPTLSESAVGEFLKGKRAIGLRYVESLLAATGLTVTPAPLPDPGSEKPG